MHHMPPSFVQASCGHALGLHSKSRLPDDRLGTALLGYKMIARLEELQAPRHPFWHWGVVLDENGMSPR